MNTNPGLLIRHHRRQRHLTQCRLASMIGVSRQLLGFWESGRRNPDVKQTEAVRQALELPPTVLGRGHDGVHRDRLVARWGHRAVYRQRYPMGATLDQMLRIPGYARHAYEGARERIGDDAVQAVLARFPRDTRHELLFVFQVLKETSRTVVTAPLWLNCRLHLLDDFDGGYAGHARQLALVWEGGEERMVIFGQVPLRGSSPTRYRVDFLVNYKPAGGRGCWLYVELDGGPHDLTPNQDAQRAETIPIPGIRYDNVKVRSFDFFQLLLKDVRRQAEDARQWERDRTKRARQLRRKRHEEAAERRLRL
jgi:transcriptional regulator with XRE-family HTH domain